MLQIINKKICLLGEFGVGKTSLVRRFVYDIFSDDYITTMGVKVTEKIIPPLQKEGNLHQFRFVIWDIAGSEGGVMKHESYWTGASGAIIVTDLCRPETIKHSKTLLTQFRTINPEASTIITGNKADLINPSEYNHHEKSLQKITFEKCCSVFLTSAKTGLAVEKGFLRLAELMLD
jgi:small GTP-binding protein